MTLEQHNVGTAYGWGGFTEDQAVYLTHFFEGDTPGTLTLKDVPIPENSFWSVTVYNDESFAVGKSYKDTQTWAGNYSTLCCMIACPSGMR